MDRLIADDIELHHKLKAVVDYEYELLMSDKFDEFRHVFVKQCRIERDIAQLDDMIGRWLKTNRDATGDMAGSDTVRLLALLRERKEQLLDGIETIGNNLSVAKRDTAASLKTLHSGQRAVRSYGVSAGNR
jgi:hypothetical protein